MRIFLHDEDCQPLGIVTLDWDVERLGQHVRIPVPWGRVASGWSETEIAHLAQPVDTDVMHIHLTVLRNKKRDGTISEGWLGVTHTPELCEKFFETKFG